MLRVQGSITGALDMTDWFLFTVASVDPQTKRGDGATLLLASTDLNEAPDVMSARIRLHKDFFRMADKRELQLIKVKGHKPTAQRDAIGRLFKLVDKAARKACRRSS